VLPTLLTPRLTLRPARDADLDALWALWTDPEVRRFLWDDEVISRERAAESLTATRGLESAGLGLWALDLRGGPGDEATVGCVALRLADAAGSVEPLVALAPGVWRRGYAAEALRAVLVYAFWTLGLAELVALVDVPNEPSHRLLERLGFASAGEVDGPRYRLRYYVLTRESYAGRVEGERSGER
jgi:RimJ/RimL family protein N-acetyltransferase